MMPNRDDIWIDLIDGPIELSSLQEKIADPDVGAHGWFVGVTRRKTSQRRPDRAEPSFRVTISLSYEAHDAMARSELSKLAEQAVDQFGLSKLVIVHRLGEVSVGEASVVVGCSSPHRGATFDALASVMETLKREVPIWKRERFADETTRWVHPSDESSSDDSP